MHQTKALNAQICFRVTNGGFKIANLLYTVPHAAAEYYYDRAVFTDKYTEQALQHYRRLFTS